MCAHPGFFIVCVDRRVGTPCPRVTCLSVVGSRALSSRGAAMICDASETLLIPPATRVILDKSAANAIPALAWAKGAHATDEAAFQNKKPDCASSPALS